MKAFSDILDIKKLKGLTQDSRAVQPGYLFAALPGTHTDGRAYIAEAVKRGACAILAPEGTVLPEEIDPADIVLLTDAQPRRAFALMVAQFYGAQPEVNVAVTGTNGKSSTVHFARQLWQALGRKAASLGTLGLEGNGIKQAGSMTTPDSVTLHEELAMLADQGITHLALEASSHGLEQNRLDGVRVRAAGFTNLSRDHLDYHGDMEHYFKSKARLFSEVMNAGGTAVLNADIPEYAALVEICKQQGHSVLSYGEGGQSLKILSCEARPSGQALRLEILGDVFEITVPLVGAFQAMNALCALGLVLAESPDDKPSMETLLKAMAALKSVPGRLQPVGGHPLGAAIYIDYAHTPGALEHVLSALRPHVQGRLVCVFGCGGDRDKGKRPLMGQVARRLADKVIVTDDNPRSEDPALIRKAVMDGARGALEIEGRRAAICAAVSDLEKGDVLVIAGKGHEQGQIFADHTDPFDDVYEVEKAIEELSRV